MGRQEKIARSVVHAITSGSGIDKRSFSPLKWILAIFSLFFALYQLVLHKVRPADFSHLRRDHWDLSDDEYTSSFHPPEGADGKKEEALRAIGDMGFSGSTFYSTSDQKYLVKSVPRYSEHSFFRDDLLTPYVQHMATHPRSLLVRICDFLAASGISLGRMLRTAPSHHIIMENIMFGRELAKQRGEVDWEDWDLKPTSYFFPERDIAEGALTSEATKDRLADEFHDKIILSKEHAHEFFSSLEADTKLLAEHNAVDYSLFLVRIKTPRNEQDETVEESDMVPTAPPAAPPTPPSWRTGIPSADGKYLFRAAILDFFWAKHKIQPRLMTFLISAWNLITNSGHMSITTTPEEYRERFMKMCKGFVEVRED